MKLVRLDMQVGARVEEVEVWQDLAEVYTELKQWHDAELCLERARALEGYSATTWHVTGELSVSNGSNLNYIGRSYCYG
jgi:cytochrome c-type biogenesis protein CcmH/NrfG